MSYRRGELDQECINLCKAINSIPGIETVESCCGHGESPYLIWIRVRNVGMLPHLTYWLDGCHSGLNGWRLEVYTNCDKSHNCWMIEGPSCAYDEADKIAELIMSDEDYEHQTNLIDWEKLCLS